MSAFRVGQLVRILPGGGFSSTGIRAGDIVRIEKIEPHGVRTRALNADYHKVALTTWFFAFRNVEPYIKAASVPPMSNDEWNKRRARVLKRYGFRNVNQDKYNRFAAQFPARHPSHEWEWVQWEWV